MKNLFLFGYILLLFETTHTYGQYGYCQTSTITAQGYPTVYTPNNSTISCIFYNDITQTEKNCFNSAVNSNYSGLTILSDATTTYNCYNYAWNMFQGGSTVAWMPGGTGGSTTNNIQSYWTDGSYTQVSWEPDFAGGIVRYVGGDHAAVTTGTSGVYKSKWAFLPLVQHTWNNVPSIYMPNGDNRAYYVRSYCACSSTPDMQLMTYDGPYTPVYTVNFVSANYWHSIYTNFPSCHLTSAVSWNPGSTVNWYNTGSKNESANLYLNSGQSVTFYMSASNHCGTSTRNPTFVAQSGYRMSSPNTNDGAAKNYLDFEFDNADYLEILPQVIIIYDQTSTKEEKRVDVKNLFYDKQFTGDGRKIRIDISKLSNGIKIINLLYPKVDGKNSEQILSSTDYERREERILVVN